MRHNFGSAVPFSTDSAMTKAFGLVQTGRLAEATALIQRTLGGDVPVAPASQPRQRHQAHAGPQRVRECLRRAPSLREHLPRLPDLGGLPTPGAPSSAPDPPGSVRTGMYAGSAGSRPYRLYVPSTPVDGPRPLLVMLHGGTQDAAAFAAATAMDAVAEEHGLLVVYPEQVTSANAMRYWNWFSPADQTRGSGEPAILAGLISELVNTEHADPSRVYVAGFSAGAAMAAVLASTHPDVVAAVGIHSGLPAGAAHDMVSAFAAMRSPGPVRRLTQPVPAITFHGDTDPIVGIANSHSLGEQFGVGTTNQIESGTAAGGRAYTVSRQTEQDAVLLEQWIVNGLGHSWSGGRAGGSYTDPSGPDASREMVRFFLAHQ